MFISFFRDRLKVGFFRNFWLKTFASNSLQFGIKLHPNCPEKEKSYIDQTLSKFSNNYFYVEQNLSIEEAIISSKVLLAQHSTTLLEAFFLRKPSICLDPTNIRKNMSFVKYKICQRATNLKELNELTKMLSSAASTWIENVLW